MTGKKKAEFVESGLEKVELERPRPGEIEVIFSTGEVRRFTYHELRKMVDTGEFLELVRRTL